MRHPIYLSALLAVTALAAACASGPLASSGRYFQYLSPDNQVVAEYATADAATCAQHLANLKRGNPHGNDAARCASGAASARLPFSAAARDPSTQTEYGFRFATMEQCQRMLTAISAGPTSVTRPCG